jgi:HTH-type transcriptional regulator / antitoxin HipB
LRILYFADSNRTFILLHGVIKNAERLEESQIQIAEERQPTTTVGSEVKELGGPNMPSRWNRYYTRLMEDPKTKEQIEKELQSLELGIQIAKLRQKQGLNQTQLAARAGMNASKVSVIENSPQNMRLGTLLRIAHALNGKLKIQLIPEKQHNAVAVARKRA